MYKHENMNILKINFASIFGSVISMIFGQIYNVENNFEGVVHIVSITAGIISITMAFITFFIQYPNLKKRIKESIRKIKYYFTKSN